MSKRKQVLIDMAALSPHEKENCVKLLSTKNVHFSKGDNGEYEAKIVVEHSSHEPTMCTTDKKTPRERTPNKQSQPNNPYAGKKPLNDVVNMNAYPRLLSLCKYIDVYICPKRMSQKSLMDITENLLHLYFKKHRFEQMIHSEDSIDDKESFPEFVYQQVMRRQKQSLKMQQSLVNLIQSVNFFKKKLTGIQLFAEFLSETYNIQQLVFFYFLRKMLQDIKEVRLIERQRLRTDLNTLPIEEQYIWVILNSFCHNNQQSQQQFNKVKLLMHYDSKYRKNVIMAYDLVNIFLQSFRANHQQSINQHERNQSQEPEQYFQPKIIPPAQETLDRFNMRELHDLLGEENSSQILQSHTMPLNTKDKFTPQQNIILLACLEALKKMCNRVNTPLQFYDRFAEMVMHLLSSIFHADKLTWFQHVKLQPTNGRLHYIESLQCEYEQMVRYRPTNEQLFLNKFVKKVLQAPGFFEIYSTYLQPS